MKHKRNEISQTDNEPDTNATPQTAEEIAKEAADKVAEEAKAVKKVARAEAKVRALKFINELEDEAVKADLILFVGKKTVERISGGSITAKVLKKIVEAGEDGLDEMELFKEFQIGRPDMRGKIKSFILSKDVKDRVWVKFDSDAGIYKVVGTGPDTPTEWTGFVPAKEAIL